MKISLDRLRFEISRRTDNASFPLRASATLPWPLDCVSGQISNMAQNRIQRAYPYIGPCEPCEIFLPNLPSAFNRPNAYAVL